MVVGLKEMLQMIWDNQQSCDWKLVLKMRVDSNGNWRSNYVTAFHFAGCLPFEDRTAAMRHATSRNP